jgi:putative SOS response-associated peptidase YedK
MIPPRNTLNAVGEEMMRKPTYRDAAMNRRCLVLSSGFYEWRHYTPPGLNKDVAYPYYVTVRDKQYFFMGGIYQQWTDRLTGETVEGFSIVTTRANSLLEQVHNKKKRMPLIFTEELAREWIMDGMSEDRINELARYQFPSISMQAVSIDKLFRDSVDPASPYEYAELPPLVL